MVYVCMTVVVRDACPDGIEDFSWGHLKFVFRRTCNSACNTPLSKRKICANELNQARINGQNLNNFMIFPLKISKSKPRNRHHSASKNPNPFQKWRVSPLSKRKICRNELNQARINGQNLNNFRIFPLKTSKSKPRNRHHSASKKPNPFQKWRVSPHD